MIKLPPSVQMLLFLLVGLVLGSIGGYKFSQEKIISETAENRLQVIIDDQKEMNIIDKETTTILSDIRKENAENKDFKCSDATLPNDRVLKLEREINNARRRSDEGLFNKIINKASDL